MAGKNSFASVINDLQFVRLVFTCLFILAVFCSTGLCLARLKPRRLMGRLRLSGTGTSVKKNNDIADDVNKPSQGVMFSWGQELASDDTAGSGSSKTSGFSGFGVLSSKSGSFKGFGGFKGFKGALTGKTLLSDPNSGSVLNRSFSLSGSRGLGKNSSFGLSTRSMSLGGRRLSNMHSLSASNRFSGLSRGSLSRFGGFRNLKGFSGFGNSNSGTGSPNKFISFGDPGK